MAYFLIGSINTKLGYVMIFFVALVSTVVRLECVKFVISGGEDGFQVG